MFDVILATPFGHIGINANDSELTRIEFITKTVQATPAQSIPASMKPQILALEKYFKTPDVITVPHTFAGTPFQRKVWQALSKIPVGQTVTYGDLAKQLKTSARAIGMGCRTNPLPVVIPCHRVVGKGHLGGFAGDVEGKLIKIKRWLLAHEGITC